MPRTYTNIPSDQRKKGEYYKYKRQIERINKKFKEYIINLKTNCKKINKKYLQRARKSFMIIQNRAITSWYKAYTPNHYKRRYSLRKIPQFEIDWKAYAFDAIDTLDEMKAWHRVDNEYIYINSFVHGWHGGADKLGPNPAPGYETPHPNPRQGELSRENTSGASYWRYPYTVPEGSDVYRWEFWSEEPAVQTISPQQIIIRNWDVSLTTIMNDYQDEILKMIEKYKTKYKEAVKKILKTITGVK